MDKRHKILVVEDEQTARDTQKAVLEREGFRVEACGNLSTAMAAIDAMRFDVALVDIMLAGRLDRSNRDGIEILRRIQEVGEGTKALVLSGQDDPDLVGDIWQKHGAHGYVGKGKAQSEGPDYLPGKIRDALKASVPPMQGRDWHTLIQALAPGGAELGIVHEILQKCTFSGGLPVLRDGLVSACKWLVPLLPGAEGETLRADRDVPGAFAGLYWSRGQGCAVQVVVHGTNTDAAEVDQHFSAESHAELHRRTKGGLTVLALARADLSRSSFAGR